MNDKKDELLARIQSTDPATGQRLPKLELPPAKPARSIRPLYLMPVAAAAAVALVLSFGNASTLIVARADQLSEYQQASTNYGYPEDLLTLKEQPTPNPSATPAPSDSKSGEPQPSQEPINQAKPTIEIANFAGAAGFIKPGEIYRARLAADFDTRFDVFKGIFGPDTQKFSYGQVGGFKYINPSPSESARCNETELRRQSPHPSVVSIVKKYASALNMEYKDVVFNYGDFYSTEPHTDIYCGSWIEIYDVLNGALREQAVQIQTDNSGAVKAAGGLISDYELMATEKLLSVGETLTAAIGSEIDWLETPLSRGFKPITSPSGAKIITAIPMYTRIYSQTGEEWYVPSYYYLYWNGGTYRGMAVKSDLVTWKQG